MKANILSIIILMCLPLVLGGCSENKKDDLVVGVPLAYMSIPDQMNTLLWSNHTSWEELEIYNNNGNIQKIISAYRIESDNGCNKIYKNESFTGFSISINSKKDVVLTHVTTSQSIVPYGFSCSDVYDKWLHSYHILNDGTTYIQI